MNNLPLVLKEEIFCYLNIQDIISLSKVSKKFNYSDSLWRNIQKKLNIETPPPSQSKSLSVKQIVILSIEMKGMLQVSGLLSMEEREAFFKIKSTNVTLTETVRNLKNYLSTIVTLSPSVKDLEDSSKKIRNLEALPNKIGLFSKLESIYLHNTCLRIFPILNLNNLVRLNLTKNKIRLIPDEIICYPSLRILDLSNNEITSISENIGQLKYLISLNLNYNKISTLPESIGNLKHLSTLKLSNNSIEHIPKSFDHLSSIEFMYLNNNQITHLPLFFQSVRFTEFEADQNPLSENSQELCKMITLNIESQQESKTNTQKSTFCSIM